MFVDPSMQCNGKWLTIATVDAAGLVHEARHADGPLHTCGNKDQTVAEMGAFGVEYLFIVWVADYSAEPQAYRDYFRWAAWKLRSSGGAFCVECSG
jgi:hypothetical protein